MSQLLIPIQHESIEVTIEVTVTPCDPLTQKSPSEVETSDAQIRRSLLPGVAATVAAQRWKRLARGHRVPSWKHGAFEAMKK